MVPDELGILKKLTRKTLKLITGIRQKIKPGKSGDHNILIRIPVFILQQMFFPS
jgi:hypothetical protein